MRPFLPVILLACATMKALCLLCLLCTLLACSHNQSIKPLSEAEPVGPQAHVPAIWQEKVMAHKDRMRWVFPRGEFAPNSAAFELNEAMNCVDSAHGFWNANFLKIDKVYVRDSTKNTWLMAPFWSEGSTRFDEGHLTIIPMCRGFESVTCAITVWEERGDSLYYVTTLDSIVQTAIGGVHIDTIYQYSPNQRLLLGYNEGGDAGEVWGRAWLGVWTLPNHLEMIYEKSWKGSVIDTHFSYRISVNPANWTASVANLRHRYSPETNRQDTVLVSRTPINLKKLLPR